MNPTPTFAEQVDALSRAEFDALLEERVVALALTGFPEGLTTKAKIAEWLDANPVPTGDAPAQGVDPVIPPVPPAPQAPTGAPEAPKPTKPAPRSSASIATAPRPQQLFYQHRPIISVSNKLMNGRTYKEITMADSVALLSEAEFAEQVKTTG